MRSVGWGWQDNWVWLVVLTLLVPAIHEVHFFCIHWVIHQQPLYKWIHSVHHNSINPSPWSSMSMHWVEATAFHAEILWHLLIPSNPIVALFQMNSTAYGAVNGHIGFEKLELDGPEGARTLDSHAYAHYLHHKYFEVNYGGEGLVPLDKWFGTWHDGSKDLRRTDEGPVPRQKGTPEGQEGFGHPGGVTRRPARRRAG